MLCTRYLYTYIHIKPRGYCLCQLARGGRNVLGAAAGSTLIFAHAIIYFALEKLFGHERILDHGQLQHITPAEKERHEAVVALPRLCCYWYRP